MFAALLMLLVGWDPKFYTVTVTKSQTDVYTFVGKWDTQKVRKGTIVTNHCYKYAWSEQAVVRYEKNSRENKILFSKDGTTCEVKSVSFDIDN